MVEDDKIETLRSLLQSDKILVKPSDVDDSQQVAVKRKVISLRENVLRIIDSGNKVNNAEISKKVELYFGLIESDLSTDLVKGEYTNFLHVVNDVI